MLGVVGTDLGEDGDECEGVHTAHFGASCGGGRVDGEPGTRTLALNPPRLLSLDCRRLSIFLILLLSPGGKDTNIKNVSTRNLNFEQETLSVKLRDSACVLLKKVPLLLKFHKILAGITNKFQRTSCQVSSKMLDKCNVRNNPSIAGHAADYQT